MPREQVEVIGPLPTYTTVTRSSSRRSSRWCSPASTLALDAFEVAEAFEVPLDFLMNPAHHRRHAFELGGVQRQFLSMPWQGLTRRASRAATSSGAPPRPCCATSTLSR